MYKITNMKTIEKIDSSEILAFIENLVKQEPNNMVLGGKVRETLNKIKQGELNLEKKLRLGNQFS